MQKDSKLYLDKDKIVRATAGAGKTTALITDVYKTYLSHRHKFSTSPKILLTTFTVKAANELSERLIKKAEEIGDKDFLGYCLSSYLEIGTMHSVFSSILIELDQNAMKKQSVSSAYKFECAKAFFTTIVEKKGLMHLFSEAYVFNETLKHFLFLEKMNFEYKVLTIDELFVEYKKELLVKLKDNFDALKLAENLKSFSSNTKILDVLDSKSDKEAIKYIELSYNKLEFIDSFIAYNLELKSLYKDWSKEFSSFVKLNGLYTLEDMEPLLLSLTQNKNFKPKWDYCFLDEYQDTSPEQKKLINRFCSESVKYFVGDPFQSIYFFRGARKEIFDTEFERISNESSNIEYKTNSYRSSKNIVKFVNQISSRIFNDFDPMLPIKTEEGCVNIAFFEDQNIDAEIDFLIESIKNLDPKDVLILSKQTKNLAKAFKKIKASGMSALPLYAKGISGYLECYELICLLKFLANQEDDDALTVLLFSNKVDISHDKISDYIVKAKEKKCSLWSLVKEQKVLSKVEELVKKDFSYGLALKSYLSESDFLSSNGEGDASHFKEFNALKLLHALEKEESTPGFNIKAFCDDLLAERYAFGKESLESLSSYKLMTVHGSKGLEAKHVFILGANQAYRDLDNYPFYFDEKSLTSSAKIKDSSNNRHLPYLCLQKLAKEKEIKKEENRRLFYVAMTRAEETLTIIGSGKKEKNPSEPSWMTQIFKGLEGKSLSFVNQYDKDDAIENEFVEKVGALKSYEFLKNKDSLIFQDHEVVDESVVDSEDVYKLSQNIKRGIEFHAYMETGVSTDKDYEKALKYLKTQKDFPFEDIFHQGQKEWGYDWYNKESGAFESGKIDLWADLEGVVWIVDYKTGSLSGAKSGFQQLNRYKNVLEEMFSEEKVFKLVLTFPFEEKTYINS